jgi:hypothetical protein
MHYGIKARPLAGVVKDQASESLSIYGAVTCKYARAELPYYGCIGIRPGAEQAVRHVVRAYHSCSKFAEHARNRALAACNSTGEANDN